jgi:hypothetical protein
MIQTSKEKYNYGLPSAAAAEVAWKVCGSDGFHQAICPNECASSESSHSGTMCRWHFGPPLPVPVALGSTFRREDGIGVEASKPLNWSGH